MRPPVLLVVAKAPVPGRAKTRLGQVVGMERAAELAAAALLDTLHAGIAAYGAERCHLAVEGELEGVPRAAEILAALAGWTVHAQRGDSFGQRLVHAHLDVAEATGAPVVQVGMDTPQLTASNLQEAGGLLTGRDSAVLGPAQDGGWWLLGVGSPHLVAHLASVPMSTDRTGELTLAALEQAGARTSLVEPLADVDEAHDAATVALAAPRTHFAAAWR